MIHGVDISGWQDGVRADEIEADFVIVKATEGLQGTVYNPAYREMADATLRSGKMLGFYHYSNGDDPVAEADSFMAAVADYSGRAVLALDWEGQGNPLFLSGQDADWCRRFLDRVRDAWGCTPILYTGKDATNALDWSIVARDYPLWGAEYASMNPVYGYQTDPWQSGKPWGAWGERPLIFQYTANLVLEHNGGIAEFDGNLMYGSRADFEAMMGGTAVSRIDLANVAARIHYDMVTDPRNGYNQQPVRWGGNWGGDKTLGINGRNYTYALGDYDCSSSTITAWRLALKGTPYEGALDGASYTGDMEEVFLASGLFYAELSPARRGDLYLNAGDHVAMCQDGGSDGVYGFDSLSEFNRNELHQASWGDPGDQDGYESVFRAYYDRPWETVLHYNHKADYYPEDEKEEIVVPTQPQTDPKNGYGLEYRAHVQTAGWMPMVRDGQTAGSEGYGKRLEAIQVIPPEGMVIDLYTHEQGYGNRFFDAIRRGVNEPVVGTVGEGRRMEAFMARVTVRPKVFEGKTLMMQAHMRGIGWMDPVPEGQWAGIRFEGKRLEAVRMWFE